MTSTSSLRALAAEPYPHSSPARTIIVPLGPESAVRARTNSTAKGKRPRAGKPKRERSVRAEEVPEEPRFHLGVPPPKAKKRTARAAAAATGAGESSRARGSEGGFEDHGECPQSHRSSVVE